MPCLTADQNECYNSLHNGYECNQIIDSESQSYKSFAPSVTFPDSDSTQ